MAEIHEAEGKAYSAYVGRLLGIPLLSLPMLAVWVMIARVLTPQTVPDAAFMLQLRWVLILAGFVLIMLCDTIAMVKMLHWEPTIEVCVETEQRVDVVSDETAEHS